MFKKDYALQICRIWCRDCQSVTRVEGREGAGRRVSVGHGREMRGCNTANPATRVVSGVLVGHFGGAGV